MLNRVCTTLGLLAVASALAACASSGESDADAPPADPAAAATAICRTIERTSGEDALLEVESAVDRYASEGMAQSELWHQLDVTCGEAIDALFASGASEPPPIEEPELEHIEEPEAEPFEEAVPEPSQEPEASSSEEATAQRIAIGETTSCTMPWAEWSCTLQEVRVAPADDFNRRVTEEDQADVILQLRFIGELQWLEDGFTSSLSEVVFPKFHGGDGLTYDRGTVFACSVYEEECLPGTHVPLQEANRTGVTQEGWVGLPLPAEALDGGRIEIEGVTYEWDG